MVPLISYVTFNRMGSTVKSLLSLLATKEDFDLYITDNDSKDKTWEWLTSLKDPRIKKIVRSEKNYGALNATNWALSHRLICQDFINFEADTVIDNPNFISDFRKALKEFPELGIISGYIDGLYEWGQFKVETKISNHIQVDITQGVFGFLYMIPGVVMDKLGFYNEASYSSDVDLNHRMIKLGYKAAWYPKNIVRIIHNPDEKDMVVFDKDDCVSCKNSQGICKETSLQCWDYYFRLNSNFWVEMGHLLHAEVYGVEQGTYCDSYHNNPNLPENYLLNRKKAMNKFSSLYEKMCTLKDREVYIVDDFFPNKLSLFRYVEFCEFLKKYKNVKVITVAADAFKSKKILPKKIQEQVILTNRATLFDPEKFASLIKISSNTLIYTVTLGLTNEMLNVCNTLSIPFVHTLYPGFGFKLNDRNITHMLKNIFNSSNFKGIILTQKCVLDYIHKNFKIDPTLVKFKHGGFAGVDAPALLKLRYPFDKKTLDICFFGHKYLPKGVDKGYGTFIDIAEKLSNHEDIIFHVGGNFSEEDIPIRAANVIFYGNITLDNIPSWFQDKDILVSPTKPNSYGVGSFDGFPTGSAIEGGIHGSTLLVFDPLNNNPNFKNIYIERDVDSIVERIIYLKDNPKVLKERGKGIQKEILIKYSIKDQLKAREDLIFSTNF